MDSTSIAGLTLKAAASLTILSRLTFRPKSIASMALRAYIREKISGKLLFSPLDTFSMFTNETFLTPRSKPL